MPVSGETAMGTSRAARPAPLVLDQGFERAVAVLFELPLDEVSAADAIGREVRDPDDAIDALAVQDALAYGNPVTSEFDPLTDRVAVPPDFDDVGVVMTAGFRSRSEP